MLTPPAEPFYKIDNHEPGEGVRLIGHTLPFAAVTDLNTQGYADYLWHGYNRRHQIERKTWNDILSDTDAVEYQLRKEMQAFPDVDTKLLIEGIATATMEGSQTWVPMTGRRLYRPSRNYRTSMSKVWAWIYQVQKYMEVYFTTDYPDTCKALVAFYNSDLKEEEDHSTFRRYLRTADFHPNPQVEALMAMGRGAGVGATRATAIIARFGTVWNTLQQMPQTLAAVDNMGLKTAKTLLRKVGKPNV